MNKPHILKDFQDQNLTIRKRYWLRELLRFGNYRRFFKWRKQRIKKGFSDRDVWNGGEYLAEVAAGILYELGNEKNIVDWDEYFKANYEDNYGYESLIEVADDLQLYVEWDTLQYQEPYWSDIIQEDRWDMDYQIYERAKNAMHFVASNLGGLWW